MPVQYDSACLSRLDTSSAIVSCRQQTSGDTPDVQACAQARSAGVRPWRGSMGVGVGWGGVGGQMAVGRPSATCMLVFQKKDPMA